MKRKKAGTRLREAICSAPTVVVLFIVAWWAYTHFGAVEPLLVPSPLAVAAAIVELFRSGTIYPHLLVSAHETALGLLFAVIVGLPSGLLMYYSALDRMFTPVYTGLYAAPLVALVPIIGLWTGLVTIWFKVAVVFLLTVFPIVITTRDGVRTIDAALLELGASFNATPWQLFRTIILPATVPSFMTGIRLAFVRGLIAVVVAEFYASNKGLGFLLSSYGGNFQTDKLLAVAVVISVISLVLLRLLHKLEDAFSGWRVSHPA